MSIRDRHLTFRRPRAEQSKGARVIHIDGVIGQSPGELSAKWLRSQLPVEGQDITLQVHCEGGSVFEALAMSDILKSHRGRVTAIVSSMALSAASLLICAADEIEVTENAYLMLHNPHMDDDQKMSKAERDLLGSLASRMVAIYASRTKRPANEIRSMMAGETFLNATEAVRFGFADRVVDASTMQISARAVPSRIVARIVARAKSTGTSPTARWRAAVVACGSVSLANKQNPSLREAMLTEVNSRR